MSGYPGEIVLTLPGFPDPALAVAACRAGAWGILDLEFERDASGARGALARLQSLARSAFGVKLDADAGKFAASVLASAPELCRVALLTGRDTEALAILAREAHSRSMRILIEVRSREELALVRRLGAHGIIAKGHEAGGFVGDETSFILLQSLLAAMRSGEALPVWVHGGIGIHTAAACTAGGAAGVVLDWQLALTREGRALPETLRGRIQAMDGSETVCLGTAFGAPTRMYMRPGVRAAEALARLDARLASGEEAHPAVALRAAVAEALRNPDLADRPWLLGQDAAFAARLATRYATVGGVLQGMRRAIRKHLDAARALRPLDTGAPLALSHRTRYPILQGPMTRVSDVAPFALDVAEGGALPFLALALMRAPEVRRLLVATREQLGNRPWGVGILGFVPLELRREQLEVILEVRPPFALIAGGRPDQAHALEREGITTYLHVPSPGLLQMFLAEGARRFVFEGRECGGHVGPRSSFVLWESMVELMLASLRPADFEALHVVFAGGIHDALSAAMVSALAAPLAEAGAKVGVLLGTAYLFTEEAVRSGAIQPGFQQEALGCRRTTLLETGPGHATRCVDTAFAREFLSEKRRLLSAGHSPDEIREALELMNLGRLRIASKGIAHVAGGNGQTKGARHARVDDATQHVQGMYMIGQVAELRHEVCTIETLHRSVSIGASDRLCAREAPRAAIIEAPRAVPSDIAIVGMGCLVPGANDLRRFWENVLGKVDAITEIPADRWDWRAYYDPDRKAPDKIYSKWGGFLEDLPFDPLRYGMPPSSLSSIEPLQLLTLEVVRAALSDAGYLHREYNRGRTSVIFGAGGGVADLGAQYCMRAHLPLVHPDAPASVYERLPKWTEDSFAGILPNVAAGRVANRFDLGGVNFTVDAACAASLAAVYIAVRDLEARASDMVVVGGADTLQNPFAFLCFAKTQALSPSGRCRPFDEEADGIAISEGLAALVLKRLEDAERDGDHVYAVIKGVGGSSDGRDRGLTAPRPEGQVRAIERAYEKAGFSPATVELFEAHGTGTVAGDQAEAQSLGTVLRSHGAMPGSCAVGSVKSMIGHTKCTAGVAGIMKVALALHDKILPPTLHVSKPNPKANFGEGPLYVNSETRPWARAADHPRRAGVSAFGFGGTNFHAVLEEYEGDVFGEDSRTIRSWPGELFVWSGADREAILAQTEPLARALESGASPELADLAFSCAAARRERPAPADALSLAVVAESRDDLRRKLGRATEHLRRGDPGRFEDPRGIYFTDAPLGREGRVAFLFPGQGSQRPDMLRDLAVYFGEVRRAFERADAVLAGKLAQPLTRTVFPRPQFTPEEERAAIEAMTDTRVAQPALGAAGVAIFALLSRLGIRPALTAGHSYGEYVALHAAGRIDERTLFEISEARGRAIVEAAEEDLGTMAAVDAPAAEVETLIGEIEGVTVANLNAPRQTIISGPRASIQKALDRMKERGLLARPLRVACAFHSKLVAPARDRLASALESIRLEPGTCEVYTNTLAAPYPSDAREALALLAEHLVRPVRFQEEIEAMHEAGARIFVEAGPGAVLTGLVRQCLEGREFLAVPVDTGKRHGLLQLLHALAQLAAQGVPFEPERLFEGRELRRIDPAALMAREETPARTTWTVNGSRVRLVEPAAAQAAVQAPAPAPAPPKDSTVPAARLTEPPMPNEKKVDPVLISRVARPDIPAPHPGDRAAVMLHYQQLMGHFLETQRSVMLAYLRGGSDALEKRPETMLQVSAASLSRPAAPATLTTPPAPQPSLGAPPALPHEESPRVQPPAPAAAPPHAAPNGGPGLTLERLTARLLEIVSERTGYPPDMLDLDVDLEADLGVDSIKRVEILGMLQAWDAIAGWKADEGFMEKVRQMKTLRSIAQLLFETLTDPSSGQPGPSARGPSPPGSSAQEPARPAPASNGHDTEGFDAPEASVASSRPAASPGEDGRPAFTRVTEPAPRFAMRAVDAPIDQADASREGLAVAAAAGAVVITDDEGGIAETLRASIESLGARAIVIPAASTDAALAERLDRAREHSGPIGAVIHLAPLGGAVPMETLDLAAWRARIDRETKALHRLIRLVGPDLRAKGKDAYLVAATLDAALHPDRGALPGLVKCLAWEWPSVRCRTVELEGPGTVDTRVAQILSALSPRAEDVVCGWRNGRRVVFRPEPAPILEVAEAIDPDAVVLVTGGARGITAEIAKVLAARFKPTLILVGRSSLPPAREPADIAGASSATDLRAALVSRARASGERPAPREIEARVARLMADREIRGNLQALADAGARILYRNADVRDPRAFGEVIEEAYATFGRIDGVIHGAGVIEDKLLEEKDSGSFDRVFDTKADSAFLLARMLRPESLRFLLFFSSVTGTFGNRGQADYGAANEVLNHLAAWLDARWAARVTAINWGPWDRVGMVSPAVRKQFAERAVQLIPVESGCRAVLEEIAALCPAEPVVVVGDGPWRNLATGSSSGAGRTSGVVPTPLLEGAPPATAGTGGLIELVRTLDLSRDRYLLHHQLEGKPVVPAAVGLALMTEAAQRAWPDLVVTGARDVRVLRGITLSGTTLPLRIALRVQTHAPVEGKEAIAATVEITEADRPDHPYYRGTILLGQTAPEPPDGSHPFSRPLGPYPLPRDEAYRRWLFHGPIFQCVSRILGVSEEGILAEILPSRPEDVLAGTQARHWLVDPALVDGCLQLALFWVRAVHGITGLPSRMGAVRLYPHPAGTPLRCSLRVLEAKGESLFRSDILCLTPEGKVALAIDGFEFTCSEALNRLMGWDEMMLPPSERDRR